MIFKNISSNALSFENSNIALLSNSVFNKIGLTNSSNNFPPPPPGMPDIFNVAVLKGTIYNINSKQIIVLFLKATALLQIEHFQTIIVQVEELCITVEQDQTSELIQLKIQTWQEIKLLFLGVLFIMMSLDLVWWISIFKATQHLMEMILQAIQFE